MFSLPYVFSKAGFVAGTFYLILFTAVLTVTHFIYSEVVQAAPGEHRFVGYARKHLGLPGFVLSIFTTGLGLLLVFTIFLVLSSSFLRLIFPSVPPVYATLIFWALVNSTLFFKINKIAILESAAVSAVALIALAIFVLGIVHPSRTFSSLELFNPAHFFLPYGAVLFAMAGRSAISSLVEYTRGNGIDRYGVRRAVVIGTIAPAVIYILFIVGALLLSREVTPDAVSGLASGRGYLSVILGCLGIFSLWESYVSLSRESEGALSHDIGIAPTLAKLTIAAVPLALHFSGFSNFIAMVGIVGGVFVALEGMMVVLMWQKVSGRKPLWSYGIVFLFLVGALYEVIKII